MSLIMFLLFGLVVGAIARFLVPGREPGGWIVSIVLGVIGSFVGGFIGRFMGLYREGEAAGFVMSVIGAIVVTIAYHMISSRRSLA